MTPSLTAAADLLRDLAADLFAAHSHRGEWQITDPADKQAKADHDRALRVATELDGLAIDAARLDPHHATLRLALAELTGATGALLKAIHDAGGYHVFDPRHQPPVHRAMSVLGDAYQIALTAASQPMHQEP